MTLPWQRHWLLCSRIFFQGCLYSEYRKTCLFSIIKVLGSLNSEFIFCNTPPSHVWSSSHFPIVIGAQRTSANNTNISGNVIAVSNKLPFISQPRVMCFLPATIKQWLANFLPCKSSKNLRPFTVLKHQLENIIQNMTLSD